jgi:hypothetical protein
MQVQINDTPKQAAMEGQWNEMLETQGSLNINSLKGRINAGRKRGAEGEGNVGIHRWQRSSGVRRRRGVRADSLVDLLVIPSWHVRYTSQPRILVRPLGVSENALSGCGEEVAQLVVLHAGKPDRRAERGSGRDPRAVPGRLARVCPRRRQPRAFDHSADAMSQPRHNLLRRSARRGASCT